MKNKKESGTHEKPERHEGLNRPNFIKKAGVTAAAVGLSSSIPNFFKPAWGAGRDHILIGRPLPITGPVSVFAQATPWVDNKAVAEMNKDGGFYIKEYDKKLLVKVKLVDTESDPTKAGDLGSKLILNDNVDINVCLLYSCYREPGGCCM